MNEVAFRNHIYSPSHWLVQSPPFPPVQWTAPSIDRHEHQPIMLSHSGDVMLYVSVRMKIIDVIKLTAEAPPDMSILLSVCLTYTYRDREPIKRQLNPVTTDSSFHQLPWKNVDSTDQLEVISVFRGRSVHVRRCPITAQMS